MCLQSRARRDEQVCPFSITPAISGALAPQAWPLPSPIWQGPGNCGAEAVLAPINYTSLSKVFLQFKRIIEMQI